MDKVLDSCTGPRFPRIPRFWGTIRQDPDKVPKNLDSWESWACAWILHFVHQDSWESWASAGLVSFLHHWSHKTCTGPRFPRIPMNKVQDSCTGPRFPRILRFSGTIKQDPDKVPKSLGILGNLGPVHESCTLFIGILGNLGPVQVWWAFSIFEVTNPAQAQDSQESRWTKCRIHAQAQDSQESQDFQELSGKTMTKFQKILGFLGILGLCMNPALCSSGFLGILGLCRFYEGLVWNYVVYSKKMHFPCVFWWWTSEFVQRVFIFWSKFWKWRTGFWFCIIGCFLRTDDCNRKHFTYSVFKKHWYLQWFLHVPHFERWRWRYICDTPPPAGRPWEGGWPYIYIVHTYIYIYIYISLHGYQTTLYQFQQLHLLSISW